MPKQLDIERLALGELSKEEEARIRAEVSPPELARALSAVARSNEEILRAYPAQRIAQQIEKRRAQAPPRTLLRLTQALSAACLVVLALTILPPLLRDESQERTKGLTPQLYVWKKSNASEPVALGDGARVKKGDVLQLGYVAAGQRYGIIASLDGRGAVTLHLPSGPGIEPKLSSQAGTIVLDSAYELDDAPSFERFFLITSDTRVDTDALVAALEKLKDERDGGRSELPAVPGKLKLVSIRVDKEQP